MTDLCNANSYVLDSNVFITPEKLYYSFFIAPHFWDKMADLIDDGTVILIDKVKNEICRSGDSEDKLQIWMNEKCDGKILKTDENQSIILKWAEILNDINNSSFYSDRAYKSWADADIADPWLIATCVVTGGTLVTFETKGQSPNRPKIPDFSDRYGFRCIDLFEMMKEIRVTLVD